MGRNAHQCECGHNITDHSTGLNVEQRGKTDCSVPDCLCKKFFDWKEYDTKRRQMVAFFENGMRK